MGSSDSKPSVSIEDGVNDIKVFTPDQSQYTFFQAQPGGCCSFSVKAAQEAHIALSSNDIVPEYEILIGTSLNTNTVIKKRKATVVKVFQPNVLRENETRHFWLKWKDNKLLLGHSGEQQAFASFSDRERIPIKYFGIRTYNGSTGTWVIKKKFEMESPGEPSTSKSKPTAPATGTTSTFSSKYSYSSADLPPSLTKYSLVPSSSTSKTEEKNVYPDLTTKKLNVDITNTAKVNNNVKTAKENTNKTNLNYLNNFKDLNIKNDSQSSTRNNNLEDLERFLSGETNTKPERNQTSDENRRRRPRGNKKSNTTDQRKPRSSSHGNNLKNQSACDNIISFDKLLEISRKSPELILVEMQPYKFERLFEIKLKKSYINVILIILSKLCQADFLDNKKPIIVGFFSKEFFRKQLLDYMYHMRLQSDDDYKKHLRHNSDMWESLFVVCKTAANVPSELQSGYLPPFVFECQNTLEALLCRDESRKNILEKFTRLKEYIDFETNRRPTI